jgi:hypothetical protein
VLRGQPKFLFSPKSAEFIEAAMAEFRAVNALEMAITEMEARGLDSRKAQSEKISAIALLSERRETAFEFFEDHLSFAKIRK